MKERITIIETGKDRQGMNGWEFLLSMYLILSFGVTFLTGGQIWFLFLGW